MACTKGCSLSLPKLTFEFLIMKLSLPSSSVIFCVIMSSDMPEPEVCLKSMVRGLLMSLPLPNTSIELKRPVQLPLTQPKS